jgi:hypothetical protein
MIQPSLQWKQRYTEAFKENSQETLVSSKATTTPEGAEDRFSLSHSTELQTKLN